MIVRGYKHLHLYRSYCKLQCLHTSIDGTAACSSLCMVLIVTRACVCFSAGQRQSGHLGCPLRKHSLSSGRLILCVLYTRLIELYNEPFVAHP
jgi:hypothetical protein